MGLGIERKEKFVETEDSAEKGTEKVQRSELEENWKEQETQDTISLCRTERGLISWEISDDMASSLRNGDGHGGGDAVVGGESANNDDPIGDWCSVASEGNDRIQDGIGDREKEKFVKMEDSAEKSFAAARSRRNGDGLGQDDEPVEEIPSGGDGDLKKTAAAASEINRNKERFRDPGSDAHKSAGPSSSSSCSSSSSRSLIQEDDEEIQTGFLTNDLVWIKYEYTNIWFPGKVLSLRVRAPEEDIYLVKYFNKFTDEVWFPSPDLKPFRHNFNQMKKRIDKTPFTSFKAEVADSLKEVGSQIWVGLRCYCLGGRVDKSVISRCFWAEGFGCESLLGYVREVARCPLENFNALETEIAGAQIKAYRHLQYVSACVASYYETDSAHLEEMRAHWQGFLAVMKRRMRRRNAWFCEVSAAYKFGVPIS